MATLARWADRAALRVGERFPGLAGMLDLRAVMGGAALVFAIRIAGAALSYGSVILLVRWLGDFEFGIYAYVWSWAVFCGIAVSLGLNAAVLRFIPEYGSRGFPRRVAGIVRRSRFVVAASGICAALAGMGFVLVLRDLMPEHYVLPAVLGFACIPVLALVALHEGIARAFGWPMLAYGPTYMLHPMLMLGGVALALALGAPSSAVTALAATLSAILLVLAIQALPIARRLARSFAAVAPRYHTRYWLAVSMPLLFMEVFRAVMEQTDILVLGALSTPQDVAAYFATVRTAGLIGFISFAVAAIAVPRIAAIHAKGAAGDLQRFVSGVAQLAFWPSLAAALLFAVAGPHVLALFDPAFTRAYPALLVLLATFLFRAATGPAEYLLNMTGHQRVTTRVVATVAVANFLGNLALVPLFGLTGAAIATGAATLLANGWLAVEVRRRLGIWCVIGGAHLAGRAA